MAETNFLTGKYPLRSFGVPEARLFAKAGLLFAGELLSG
jgi:hypothetical protein